MARDFSGRLFRLFPPETAHGLAIRALAWGLGPKERSPADPILATSVAGLTLSNPIGLAAGFDKNAQVPDAMLRLGFGFTEVGTITPLPQPGNPKPRLFRDVASEAVINRMGFNGEGLNIASARLEHRSRHGIVGANVGRNKTTQDPIADYVICIKQLAPLVDYLVINVSSPNTPGLRDLQEAATLQQLLQACVAAGRNGPPIFLKIAPDLDDEALAALIETALAETIAGLIVSNTTVMRPEGLPASFAEETGGLSGRPLFNLSTQKLRRAYTLSKGQIPLIGVGGISSGADAYKKIRAGASLIQLYSAMVFKGPGLVRQIKADLARYLRADGFKSVAEAVGKE